MRLTYWQAMSFLFITLKLCGQIFIGWHIALAPLAVHLLIRLEEQYRLMKHGKRMPITWWLQ